MLGEGARDCWPSTGQDDYLPTHRARPTKPSSPLTGCCRPHRNLRRVFFAHYEQSSRQLRFYGDQLGTIDFDASQRPEACLPSITLIAMSRPSALRNSSTGSSPFHRSDSRTQLPQEPHVSMGHRLRHIFDAQKHAAFVASVTIHELGNVPQLEGEFAVRWKFRGRRPKGKEAGKSHGPRAVRC